MSAVPAEHILQRVDGVPVTSEITGHPGVYDIGMSTLATVAISSGSGFDAPSHGLPPASVCEPPQAHTTLPEAKWRCKLSNPSFYLNL
jgi:hypothetical protein